MSRWDNGPLTAEDAETAEGRRRGGVGPAVSPRSVPDAYCSTVPADTAGPTPTLRFSAASASSAVNKPLCPGCGAHR